MTVLKRLWVFFAALAVCTVLAGVDEGEVHDAAALVPVQALVIDAKDGTVLVTTDTGDVGRGGNLDAALSDLQSGCAGALFTQTAEHVIVTSRAWYLAPQVCVSRQLRPAAKLYRAMEKIEEPEQALRFLQAHPGNLTLSHARAALLESREEAAPVLMQTEGGFRLGG